MDVQNRVIQLKAAGLSDAQIDAIVKGSEFSSEILSVQEVEKDPYIEIGGLPSGGRYYKNQVGIPCKLKGQPLKVRDSIVLEAMENSNDSEVIDDIFKRRIKGVSPGDILIGDELYILAWLREQTFTKTPLRKSFICSKCGHLNEDALVPLDKLMVYYLPASVTDPMSCKLPISGNEIALRFMRRKDKVRIENFVNENLALRKLKIDDAKLLEIASVLHGMGITDGIEMLENLDPTDFAVINNFFIKMNFGFNKSAFLTCEKEECGFTSIVPIPFQDGYFLPKIGPDLSYED
ncbi:MAG: hypothetical protein M0R17_00565 [Candidatus Omnitrophica bacterium]|jgi:hypothetical protein|nr:hypothetical protein [Candidatus Omnitrophota bacterium]